MSIDQVSTTRAGYFFSPFKSVVMVGSIVPIIPLAFYAYSSTGNNWAVVGVTILLYLIIYSFILRYVVFEERRLKKMLSNLEENKISKGQYFWGINEIDDEGVIHYRYNAGLKKAVVVKICRGSTVGRNANFEYDYSQANLNFTRSLLRSKFSFTKYSRLETRELPTGLKDYIKRLESMEDEAQRTLMRMNIDTMSNFVKDNKKVISDYYVIYNTDVRLIKTFKVLVRDFVKSSYGNDVYFRNSHVLDTKEVLEFIAETLNVKTVNRSGYLDETNATFEDFGEIFRLIDKDGEELNIDFGDTYGPDGHILQGKGGRSIDSIEKMDEQKAARELQRKKIREEQELKRKERLNKNQPKTPVKEEIPILDDDDELVEYVDENGNVIDISQIDLSTIEVVEDTTPQQQKSLNTLSEDVDLFSLDED